MKRYILLLLPLFLLLACEDDDLLPALEEVAAPSALSLDFEIAGDNSGQVTIFPGGQGVTLFRLDFGDGSPEATELAPGESVQHVYPQGSYTLGLEGMGVNGLTTSFSQELNVDFVAPENLVVTITGTPGNPLSIDVTATADLETGFAVYFGDVADEEPTTFLEGETVSHAYTETGDYEVRVVARSGGSATVEETTTVTINNPVVIPVDFENPNLAYDFNSFGNASAQVVDNPDVSEGNNSARVGELNKPAGSETWAGTFLEMGEPLDLATFKIVRIKSWSPDAGIPVLMKLENSTNPDFFHEVTVNTSVANGWEELEFDFSAADLSDTYSKVVLFYNFGDSGRGARYYFDDIELTDGSAAVELPLNFESPDVEFTFTGFGGATAEVVDNPDASGINTSSRVGAFTKMFNSETWGGVFIDSANPIDFSSTQKIRLKIWSPEANATILLKLENPDNPDDNREIPVNTTGANAWEELEYDFSGIEELGNIRRVVLFCDFGNTGTEQTYYFDDIRLVN